MRRGAIARKFGSSMDYWAEPQEAAPTTAGNGRPVMGVRNPFAYLRAADREPLLFSPEEALARIKERLPPAGKKGEFRAFFSSVMGGITTCPSLMSVPADDHMVHRGHAVFDTANVKDGLCYGLDFHLDRILKSAKACRIENPPSKEEMRKAILATIAASGRRDDVFVRYWLSAGRGDFGVSPRQRHGSCQFYVMVHDKPPKNDGGGGVPEGVAEVVVPTSQVPIKPTLLATAKTTNYLVNALLAMEAEDKGGKLGIGFDESTGLVTESSIACVGFLGPDGVFRCPRFETILESTTLRRGLELIDEQIESGGGITGVDSTSLTDVTLDHVREAVEVIFFGGGAATPITEIDYGNGTGMQRVGGGGVGPLCTYLVSAFEADMRGMHHSDNFLDEIPYDLYEKLIFMKKERSPGRIDGE